MAKVVKSAVLKSSCKQNGSRAVGGRVLWVWVSRRHSFSGASRRKPGHALPLGQASNAVDTWSGRIARPFSSLSHDFFS